MGAFTADDVAAAADVSRRTFFNYFPSPEAALASYTQGYLDAVLGQLVNRPAAEPLLESARHALLDVTDPAVLAPMAEIFARTHDHPQLARYELEAWANCSDQIIAAASVRLGPSAGKPADELYISILVGAVMAAGKAALKIWCARTGAATTAESLTLLRALLADALGQLQHGFNR
jgi:AcrR family transcriptional regulator